MNNIAVHQVTGDFGPAASLIIGEILYWIRKNKDDGRNFYDGSNWTYNSLNVYAKKLNLKKNTVQYALKKLIDGGILRTVRVGGIFSPNKYDRTKAYAFTEKGIRYLSGESLKKLNKEQKEQTKKPLISENSIDDISTKEPEKIVHHIYNNKQENTTKKSLIGNEQKSCFAEGNEKNRITYVLKALNDVHPHLPVRKFKTITGYYYGKFKFTAEEKAEIKGWDIPDLGWIDLAIEFCRWRIDSGKSNAIRPIILGLKIGEWKKANLKTEDEIRNWEERRRKLALEAKKYRNPWKTGAEAGLTCDDEDNTSNVKKYNDDDDFDPMEFLFGEKEDDNDDDDDDPILSLFS